MVKTGTSEGMTTTEQAATMGEERDFLTKLMTAAVNGDGTQVQRRIMEYSTKNEIPPLSVLQDIKDGSKRSVVHFACVSMAKENQEYDIVELLLKKMEFPSSALESIVLLKDVEGMTPLMFACQNMHEKTYERIKCILDINPKTALDRSKAGATALHYAAGAGASKEVIDLLYENGKDALNACTLQGSTPLHWASSDPPPKDYTETLNALFDLGADVNTCSEGGIPALVGALASSNDTHAELLVEHGADRGVILGGNVTLFHLATDLNLKGTLAALLEVDANADDQENSISAKCLKMKNDKDETPLDLAAQRGHFECFKLVSGEQDGDKAKTLMMALQKEWNEKRKNQPEEKDEKTEKKAESPIVIDEETEAKTAAAMLLSDPPSISDEDMAKAGECKAKGNAHFGKKEWSEAIAAYSDAIKLNPTDETYYSNRSASYIHLKKHEEALHDAVICRHLKPKWMKGCYRLAVARLALDRYEDAAVSAWEGLNLEEGNPELEALVTKCIKKGRKEHLEKTKGAK